MIQTCVLSERNLFREERLTFSTDPNLTNNKAHATLFSPHFYLFLFYCAPVNLLFFIPFGIYLLYVPGKTNIKAQRWIEHKTPGKLIGGLGGSTWDCIRWPSVKWCKRRLMWGSVGGPLLLPSAIGEIISKERKSHRYCGVQMNAVFVLASRLSHTELRKSCLRLLRLTQSMHPIWYGVVNLNPGSLEG